ncbi:hypothetical protein NORO109296_07755 [Nocardiopsis rhodophaea]
MAASYSNPGLTSGQGNRGHPTCTKRQRGKGRRLLFAGGHQLIGLTRIWVGRYMGCGIQKVVRHAAHGRDNDDHRVSFTVRFADAIRHGAYPGDSTQRRSPVFLHNESHAPLSPIPKESM